MRHTRTWTISLPPEMKQEVLKLAKEEHRTKSELIREALRVYLFSRRLRSFQRIGVARAKVKGIRTEADVDRIIHEFRAGK